MALPFTTFAQNYYFNDFNTIDKVNGWQRFDVDGDGKQWADYLTVTDSGGNIITPASLISRSWETTALTPNNWIISPAINLTAATGLIDLTWKVQAAAAAWDKERYTVYVGTTRTMAALSASPIKFTEIYDDPSDLGTQYLRSIDVSSFAGKTIYIAFRHHDVTNNDFISIDDVTVSKRPATVPSCAAMTYPANAAVGINHQTPLTLTWNAPTGSAIAHSYDVYFSTNANPTTLLGNTVSTALKTPVLLPATKYYWKVVPKNTVGVSSGCAIFSFTTAANSFAPYCGALAYDYVEPITLVKFANINNSSTAALGGVGHENFSSISTNVTKGSSYPITLKGNTNGPYSNKFVVFIDWNKNGKFNDAGEVYEIANQLTNSTGTDAVQISQTIGVPANAVSGTTRMRVKKVFIGSPDYLDPCSGATYGQVEDYSLNVNVGSLSVSDDVTNSKVNIFPNPFIDVLNIEALSKVNSIEVYDNSGKLVSTQTLNAVKSKIDLGKLEAGVYILNIQTENETQSVKIIKK